MSIKRRIKALECISLEQQVARLQAYMASLTLAELNLILEVAHAQKAGFFPREYSADEVATFERSCEFMATIPDSVHSENTRRTLAELLTAGKIDKSEIIERWGKEFVPG